MEVKRAGSQPNQNGPEEYFTGTDRCGRVQRWGGPIEEIRPGDVVSIAGGEKHRHLAAPTTAMTHIAIQEKVTDEEYRASPDANT